MILKHLQAMNYIITKFKVNVKIMTLLLIRSRVTLEL